MSRFREPRTQQRVKPKQFPQASVYGWDFQSVFTVSLWMTASTGASGLIGVIQAQAKEELLSRARCIGFFSPFSTPAAFLPPRRHESSRLQAGAHACSSAWCPLFGENIKDARCNCAPFDSTLIVSMQSKWEARQQKTKKKMLINVHERASKAMLMLHVDQSYLLAVWMSHGCCHVHHSVMYLSTAWMRVERCWWRHLCRHWLGYEGSSLGE